MPGNTLNNTETQNNGAGINWNTVGDGLEFRDGRVVDTAAEAHGPGIGREFSRVETSTAPIHESSDAEAAQREHGATGFGREFSRVETSTAPIHESSDAEAAQRDHGATGFGRRLNPVDTATGPIRNTTNEEMVAREFGVGTSPTKSLEDYGVNRESQKKIMKRLTNANRLNNVAQELQQLPDDAVQKIIEHRYRNVNSRIDILQNDKQAQTEWLSKQMPLDLEIIQEAVKEGRNLDDLHPIQGMDDPFQKHNIDDLLNMYKDAIQKFQADTPLIDAKTNEPVVDPETNQPITALDAINNLQTSIQQKQEK